MDVMTREQLAQIRTLAENEPREHIKTIVTSLCDELLKAWDERDALAKRGDELRQTIVNLTRSTPYPEEAEENRQRVGVLLAQIGSLKAELAEWYGKPLKGRGHTSECLISASCTCGWKL